MKRHLQAVFVLLSAAGSTEAQFVFQPAELGPGDDYRLIFTTAETTDALSADIDYYNNFVQTAADNSPIVGSWGLEWKSRSPS